MPIRRHRMITAFQSCSAVFILDLLREHGRRRVYRHCGAALRIVHLTERPSVSVYLSLAASGYAVMLASCTRLSTSPA